MERKGTQQKKKCINKSQRRIQMAHLCWRENPQHKKKESLFTSTLTTYALLFHRYSFSVFFFTFTHGNINEGALKNKRKSYVDNLHGKWKHGGREKSRKMKE